MKGCYRLLLAVGALLAASCSDIPKEIPAYTTDFCSQIHNTDSSKLSDKLEPLADSMTNKTGVYVLEDGGNAMITRAYLC